MNWQKLTDEQFAEAAIAYAKDRLTDAALEAVYVARWQARNAGAPSTEQPRPSALSRIWAILRGRG